MRVSPQSASQKTLINERKRKRKGKTTAKRNIKINHGETASFQVQIPEVG